MKARLTELRKELLNLHKALVDSERETYEKTFGSISSPNALLQLLTSDPWFAWLHAVSQLIVAMDEALDEKEPLTGEVVDALFDQTRRLLVATESGEGFGRHYFEAMQRDPAVVLAHAATIKLLSQQTPHA